MKTNQGAIVLAERAADNGRLRSVLREWGYEETEIQRVLKERHATRKLDESDERSTQLTHVPLADSSQPPENPARRSPLTM